MKKWHFYYILFITAGFYVLALGMFKEMFTGGIQMNIPSLSLILLFFISAAILIANMRKIKLNTENIFFIKNKIYIKISIVVLFLLTLNVIISQILLPIRLSKQYDNIKISPMLYFVIVIFIAYLFFLVKLFQVLRNEEKGEREELNLKKIGIKEFKSLGELPKKIEQVQFVEKQEFNINKKTYSTYPPVLHSKKHNEKGDFVLNFTNKNDLSFAVLIQNGLTVSIKFASKDKSNAMIASEVFKTLIEYTIENKFNDTELIV